MLGSRNPFDGPVFETREHAVQWCVQVMVDHFDRGLGMSDARIERFSGMVSVLTVLFFILCVSGCASGIMPVSNGSQSNLPEPGTSAVVWGNHSGAVGQTVTLLQQAGIRIVERARLRQIIDEQKIILTHTSEDEAQLLQVGKILGADSIVFVEATMSSSQMSRAFVNQYGGGSRSETVTNVSVSVRGVDVESGEIMWNGMAHYPQAINNPEAGIIYLTQHAVVRGLCPAWAWKNEAEGCDQSKIIDRGVLGFQFESKASPEGRQLVITEVMPGTPAEQVGLRVGDVLLSCNGKTGFQTRMQYQLMCRFEPGQVVTLRVKRADRLINISVTAVSHSESQK